MNVRTEIERYADEADKPVLLWLFERYHYASQWQFVARGEIPKPYTRRIWSPTREGRCLFNHLDNTP